MRLHHYLSKVLRGHRRFMFCKVCRYSMVSLSTSRPILIHNLTLGQNCFLPHLFSIRYLSLFNHSMLPFTVARVTDSFVMQPQINTSIIKKDNLLRSHLPEMNVSVFWNATPCNRHQGFGGTYYSTCRMPWRWTWQMPPERWYLATKLCGVTVTTNTAVLSHGKEVH